MYSSVVLSILPLPYNQFSENFHHPKVKLYSLNNSPFPPPHSPWLHQSTFCSMSLTTLDTSYKENLLPVNSPSREPLDCSSDGSRLKVGNRRSCWGDRSRPWEWDLGGTCALSPALWGQRLEVGVPRACSWSTNAFTSYLGSWRGLCIFQHSTILHFCGAWGCVA